MRKFLFIYKAPTYNIANIHWSSFCLLWWSKVKTEKKINIMDFLSIQEVPAGLMKRLTDLSNFCILLFSVAMARTFASGEENNTGVQGFLN